MATITVNTSDTFEQWRVKTNSIGVTIEDFSNNISTKNVIATGTISASGNVTVSANLIVTNVISGTSTIGNLTVNANASLSGNVTSNLVVDGNVSVTKNVVLSSEATVSGNLTVSKNATVSGNVNASGNLNISKEAYVTGNITISKGGTVGSNLAVTGNIIAGDSFVGNGIVPTGSLLMWSLASAPLGYLICDGTAVSRTTYKRLYDVIGTTFGVGDGSSTFNLPNYTNRFPVGAGSSYSVAGTGGSATTTISASNLPAHDHSISDSGHSHGLMGSSSTGVTRGLGEGGAGGSINVQGGDGTPNRGYVQTTPRNGYSDNYVETKTTGITQTNSTQGSGSAFSNSAMTTVPPYLGIYFIIKT